MTATSVRTPSRAEPAPVVPPGESTPVWLQTAHWLRSPTRYFDRCRRRYGPVFTVEVWGFGKLLIVADRDLIKEAFTGDPQVLHAGEGNSIEGLFELGLGPNSLLILDGDRHLRHRRLMLPPFHGKRMQGYAERMHASAERSLADWPEGEPFEVMPRMHEITLDVILSVVFGLDDRARVAEFRRAALPFVESTGSNGVMIAALRRFGRLNRPYRRFLRARAEMDRLLYEEISRRRADAEAGDDVISMLLAARFDDGSAMSDQEVRDELMTLLIAGHETTGSALAWTIDLLTQNTAPLERLVREIDAGEDESYLDAVITESLRLRPVLDMVARVVKKPMSFGPYELEPGITIAPNIWLAHREPDVYPEPYRFKPERFLEDGPDTYAWLPFGGGIRRCIGASFAQYEMKVVLKAVLSRVRLRAAHPQPDPVTVRNITLAPGRGVRVVAERR